jgi:nucleotide-binding universal stress UspA family protein
MKLLIPVDGSPASLRAVKLGINMAIERQQGSIILLNVQNVTMLDRLEHVGGMLVAWLKEEEERLGTIALEGAMMACQAAGVLFTVRREKGVPAAMIDRVAREEKVDHIIMGRRGLGGIHGLLLGSVSTQVLHLVVDVPVTLVK